MREAEAHDLVARLQQRVVDGRVGLRARVRLDVGVLGAEQRLRAVDRQLLDHVDELAAAVVALARVALGVLVGQHRALTLEDRLRHEVLRSDHLQRALLALDLVADGLGHLGVDLGKGTVEVVGLQRGHAVDGSESGGPVSMRPRDAYRRGRFDGAPRGLRPPAPRRLPGATIRHSGDADVDHRRRHAGQLATVEHEVGARADGRRHLVEAARVGAAGAGSRWTAAPARPTGARNGTRRPSVSGSVVQASGKRRSGLGSSSVTPPGSSAAEVAPLAEVEEHHRRGLLRRAPLERVEPGDGVRVLRVARQPVDRVGGEDGHAAARRCTRRAPAPARRRGVLHVPCAPRAHRAVRDQHALDPGQVARRARRARTPRRGRAPRSRPAWPSPCSSARNGARTSRTRRADHREPVAAAEQRERRLVAGDLRHQHVAVPPT